MIGTVNSNLIILLDFMLLFSLLIKYSRKPEKAFGITLLWLLITKQVNNHQIIISIGNESVLILVLLILCSSTLEKTKILSKVSQYIISDNFKLSWIRLYIISSISSSVINNTAVVSTLINKIKNNNFHPSNKLLITLSYASIIGGTLTLVGTSTNLIINGLLLDNNLTPFGFFDFTFIGTTIIIICLPFLFLLLNRIPDKSNKPLLATNYFVDFKVKNKSKLIGNTIDKNKLRNLESLFLTEIIRNNNVISPVSPKEIIQSGDRLIFSGDIKRISQLKNFDGLTSFANTQGLPVDNLIEVVLRGESSIVGKTLKQVRFRSLYDSAVVGIHRNGDTLSGKLGTQKLKSGDYLTLATGENFIKNKEIKKNFFVISDIKTDEVFNGFKEYISVVGFFTALLFPALGFISLFKSLLILLLTLLITKCINIDDIIHRLPIRLWSTIISAMLFSQAIINSSIPEYITKIAVNNHFITPVTGLILLYISTWIITELITNNAAAILIFPVAYSLSRSLNIEIHPFALCVAFAASASFVSPYGYQTNLMVFSAGKYKLTDFIKIGLPISILYGIIVIYLLNYLYL